MKWLGGLYWVDCSKLRCRNISSVSNVKFLVGTIGETMEGSKL